MPLAPCELRFSGTFFEKRLHARRCVLGPEHFDECFALYIDALCKRNVKTVVDRALGETHRDDCTRAIEAVREVCAKGA